MEKQPETEQDILKKILWVDSEPFEIDHNSKASFTPLQILNICKAYETERQKIEAQQVAGLSLEDCLGENNCNIKMLEKVSILDGKSGNLYQRLIKSIEMYASACVADKEKEIEKYKEALLYTHQRIQELESKYK